MEVGFTAGVSVNEHSLVASYFARFMLMRPYIVRPTTVTQVLPATFKGLLEAVAKATATQVVIVAHGYSDGSGLFLPLVMGKAHTTMHYDLDKLMTIAKRVPPVATDAAAGAAPGVFIAAALLQTLAILAFLAGRKSSAAL